MRSASRVLLKTLGFALLGAALGSAQSAPFDFNLIASVGTSVQKIPNNQTLTFNTDVGTNSSIVITATYIGTSQATISAQPSPSSWFQGSTEFSISVPPKVTFPLVLTPGQTLTFTITYAPTSASQATGLIQVPYAEPLSGVTLNSNIILQLVGQSASYTLAYALAPQNNVVQLTNGGTIQFLPTQINTTANATLFIANSGSGSGGITGISLATSSVFQLVGVPLASKTNPFPLQPGASLSVGVQYTPGAVQTAPDSGQITITFLDGTTETVNLSGNGATSTFKYSYLSNGTPQTVLPNGTITLPSVTAPTGGTTTATSSVIFTAKNAGNANGVINSINATGPFLISGQPNPPPTLKPGDSESFTITYTPTAVGTQTGSLQVGNDTFALSAKGLGPQLSYSYVENGATIQIQPPLAADFTPVAVGQSQKITFIITNNGTITATVSLISTSAPFSLTPQPKLPLSLAAGQSSQFGITFTPTTTATVSQTLQIDNTQVQLIGSGLAPPSLPSYTLSGPNGSVSPVTQGTVSLTLAKSYPVDLNGVLTLTSSGNFGTDQSVQFTTGGRTVDFTIPANGTSADFAGQGSQIFLQTGTVAETVTLTPSFTTAGGVNVTPTSPTTLQFTVPSSAPVLTTLQPTNESSSSFTLVAIGYTTTRDLSSITVTFTPAPGYNLTTSQFTTNLNQVASLWFQGAGSQGFGGQFQIALPISLTGTVPNGKTLLGTIASVSATVTNSVGTSTAIQASLP